MKKERKEKDLITIRLSDGSRVDVKRGTTPAEIAGKAALRSIDGAVIARLNGVPVDLNRPIREDGELSLVMAGEEDALRALRHSTSHVMAYAVTTLFPGTKVAIGPPIEDGFYYDFDPPRPFSPEDLLAIEEKMAEICRADHPFVREEWERDQAIEFFRGRGEPYKVELIREIPEGEAISVYRCGEFIDLCEGPHVLSTGLIRAFKLVSIAGAYWRGDERNPMLQRLYGSAYFRVEELDEHVRRLEEIKRRDHRVLGRQLDLFSLQDEAGPGLVFWHPKGAIVRNLIENFWKVEHYRRGYQLVYTPHVANQILWERSGHLDYYRESMYPPMTFEEGQYYVKPMNCPFHILIFKEGMKSYRDLPLRWAELGTVYRFERSGVLHGTKRVRGFTQDDAHIFCRPDQLQAEVEGLIAFTLFFLQAFGFEEYEVYLSTRPEKYVGTEENWEVATNTLREALSRSGLEFRVDPGEGVFYGPKIDIKIRDALRRVWQCTTIQIDYNLPEKFDVHYIGSDGVKHRPIMIHRALLGSLERFFGVLIEHYGGDFPLWLAPVQAVVIPVTDSHHGYAKGVGDRLTQEGFRVQIDDRSEKVGFKIREAELQRIPCMLVVGAREAQEGKVSVRRKGRGDLGAIPIEELIRGLAEEVQKRMR